jgi:hypothetical protein
VQCGGPGKRVGIRHENRVASEHQKKGIEPQKKEQNTMSCDTMNPRTLRGRIPQAMIATMIIGRNRP